MQEDSEEEVRMNIEDDMNFLPALIAAMMIVESGPQSTDHSPRIVGDHGQALGCLQIHKEVIADVNRIYKTHFRHEDALNPVLAKEICELYLRHWARPHFAQGATRGKPALTEIQKLEICARIWNGGPAGHKKASTEKYWAKVRNFLPAKYAKLNGGNQ